MYKDKHTLNCAMFNIGTVDLASAGFSTFAHYLTLYHKCAGTP